MAARSRAGRSTQRASAGPSGECQRSRRRRQSRAPAMPAATGAEQGGGELAAIQRGATGRRQAVALCGRIVQGRGVWGGGGGRNYHSTLPHIKLIKLII